MTAVYVTGAARSGTKFVAEALAALGVHATHEKSTVEPAGGDGSGRGFRPNFKDAGTVEVSSDGVYRVRDLARLDGMQAIGHVIRHPQDVVASLVGRGMWDQAWGPRRSYEWPALGLTKLDDFDRSLLYWIIVNQWIDVYTDDLPVVQFDVREPVGALTVLARLAGIELEPAYTRRVLDELPSGINHREDAPPKDYHWARHDTWLAHIAETMAEGYGLRGSFR